MMTHAAEEKLYILGHPIGHSKSPVMYNAVYPELGLPWEYGAADLPDEAAAQAFLDVRDFLSINITTPYKPLAYASADAKAATARLARGANLLVKKTDKLIAYNVDGIGCVSYLQREGVRFAGKRVVICGTGPTALAILHAVAECGAAEVLMLGRNRERTQSIVNRYLDDLRSLVSSALELSYAVEGKLKLSEIYDEVAFKFGTYATSKKAIAQADVIIDATTLGMQEIDPAPFDTELLHAGQVVFDTVYGHGTTALIAAAKECGARAFDGAGMLVAQAVATVGIVCDIAAPQVELPSFDLLFNTMAKAADFNLAS